MQKPCSRRDLFSLPLFSKFIGVLGFRVFLVSSYSRCSHSLGFLGFLGRILLPVGGCCFKTIAEYILICICIYIGTLSRQSYHHTLTYMSHTIYIYRLLARQRRRSCKVWQINLNLALLVNQNRGVAEQSSLASVARQRASVVFILLFWSQPGQAKQSTFDFRGAVKMTARRPC